jgi:hypothetical protein
MLLKSSRLKERPPVAILGTHQYNPLALIPKLLQRLLGHYFSIEAGDNRLIQNFGVKVHRRPYMELLKIFQIITLLPGISAI